MADSAWKLVLLAFAGCSIAFLVGFTIWVGVAIFQSVIDAIRDK